MKRTLVLLLLAVSLSLFAFAGTAQAAPRWVLGDAPSGIGAANINYVIAGQYDLRIEVLSGPGATVTFDGQPVPWHRDITGGLRPGVRTYYGQTFPKVGTLGIIGRVYCLAIDAIPGARWQARVWVLVK